MAQLDHASFQLTPTRTRCDLVIFYGGKSEKLASGLFEPFVSHLKSLQDEISRGGYSITLRPPTRDAHWFTKPTFQRFVRFVSTPAVLERFVSIEKEILQIESSVQSEEGIVSANGGTRKSADSFSSKKGDHEEAADAAENENSKVHLQRLLGTRLALLRREQAMAYARGLVAGFEIHNLDPLIMFADAFGASRLREACINFRELHKKKHTDGLWREELAAMAACSSSELQLAGVSGIVMANETDVPNQNIMLNLLNGGLTNNSSNSGSTPSHASLDGKTDNTMSASDQVPMQFPNQNPPYFYGIPPYHGYPFPNMQPFPPHYPSNMHWPPSMDETSYGKQFDYRRTQRSSSRSKKNYPNRKESEYSEEGRQTDSSDSTYTSDNESDTQQEKRHSSSENLTKKKSKKKSSRKVVIQNINYITPKRKDGNKGGVSDEFLSDEGADEGDSDKQKFAKAEELLLALHESNSHDTAVENSQRMLHGSDIVSSVATNGVGDELLVMSSSDSRNSLGSRPTVEFGFEEHLKKPTPSLTADPLVMMERNGRNEGMVKLEDFRNEVNFRSGIERKDGADEDKLFLQRSEEQGIDNGYGFSTVGAESTVRKSWRGEDWFSSNNLGNAENQMVKPTVFDGDCIFPPEKANQANNKGMCIDDSFFIQSRSAVENMYESRWKTEDADLSLSEQKENVNVDTLQDKHGLSNIAEPEDLYMVRERDSKLESNATSWPVDYAEDIAFQEADRRCSGVVETPADVDEKPSSNGTNANLKKINKVPGTKDREARSSGLRKPVGSNRFDIKSKKPSPASRPTVHKSKQEKEEEIRKKMEEMAIERQKRIAEKTAAGGFAPPAARRVSLDSKTARSSTKNDRSKLQSTKRTSLPL
ncbi:COP1-interacting protein 7 isoform X2 [Argentina anserina]|uniref:COP1-interacting protein 7 isoform X2 n=1 Tax=Argentina anserina TaxID=57926 RepID=UPI0021766B46|nr:COP1-interacting protein 7 isoform X2 [Potentilla anserina]